MSAGQSATISTCPTLSVWDSANKDASITLSGANGNLVATGNGSSSFGAVRAKKGTVGTGRYYWEVLLNSASTSAIIGIVNSSFVFSAGNWVGFDANSIGYLGNTGGLFSNGATTSTYTAFTTADTINFALDIANSKFYVGKNGTWQNSGNPDAGTGSVASSLAGGTSWYPAISNGGGANTTFTATADFGLSTFASSPSGITTFYRGLPYQ